MDWYWFDPDRSEFMRWWSLTEQSAPPIRLNPTSSSIGENVLDDVAMVADAIAIEFAISSFSVGETISLIEDRIIPDSFSGDAEVRKELLRSIDDLWALAEGGYLQVIGRRPDMMERKAVLNHAISVIRSRNGDTA